MSLENARWTDIAIVILTVGIVAVSLMQWHEMHTGASDTHDLAVAAKAQADAARTQAEDTKTIAESARSQAANTQSLALATSDEVAKLGASVREAHRLALAAEEANKNAIDAERPWVGVVSVSADPIASGKSGVARVNVVNSGRRPARLLRFRVASGVFGGFPEHPPFPNSTAWPDLSQTVLLPGMGATNEFPFAEISPGQFEAMAGGVLRFYIYGVIDYEDVRVKGTPHSTSVCLFWTATKSSAPFATCPEHNEAN